MGFFSDSSGSISTALSQANTFIDTINSGVPVPNMTNNVSSKNGGGKLNTIDVKTKSGQLLTKRFLTEKDAYVTGFFYCTADSFPPGFISYLKRNYSGGWTEEKVIEIFSSSATQIQLPSETLKTIQFNGKGGFNRTSPLFSQKGNTITVEFLADQDMQITTILTAWYDYISQVADGRINSDLYTGLESLVDGSSTNIYGANFYYCTLLPNMNDIVFAFAAEGFYPTTTPISEMGHAVNSHDALRHSVTFSIDYYDSWIKGKHQMLWLKNLMLSRISMLRNGIGGGSFSLDSIIGNSNDDMNFKLKYEEEEDQNRFSQYAKENSVADKSIFAQQKPPNDYDDFQLKNNNPYGEESKGFGRF